MNPDTKTLLLHLFDRIGYISVGERFRFYLDNEKVMVEVYDETQDYYGGIIDCWTFTIPLALEELADPDTDLNALLQGRYDRLYQARKEAERLEKEAKQAETLARQAAHDREEYQRLKKQFEGPQKP